jgi:hypothetical protein
MLSRRKVVQGTVAVATLAYQVSWAVRMFAVVQ